MRAYIPAAAACAALALACGPAAPAVADSGAATAFTISDPRIAESSGLTASHRHPGVYWTHNDSGDGPYVYAVDSATGRTVARVTMRGVHPRDVEAISTGPDGDLYVGDIGDNLDGSWPEVWIYRFPEPRQLHDQTVDVTRYAVHYDAGPRNAESLMVQPRTGRVYIASKNENGGHLYAGPAGLSAKSVNVFRSIADVPWVTDGAFSPDGSRLVLRGYFWASDYRWVNGRPQKIGSLDVPMQQQGESVTFTADGRAVMYGSEGAGSRVRPERLSGADLPVGVAPKPGAPGSGSTGGTGGPAESAVKDAKSSSASSKVLGIAILVGMGAVGVGVRNAARRRRDRRAS
ncbi:hypothetical protein [Streptomyces sp.]|uniref:hypothetical protein n=1 Tax=Streptomyces sp. TaxID=1931 RepID=UPI002F42A81A